MKRLYGLAVGLLGFAGFLQAEQLINSDFKVDLTPDFPGVVAYSYAGHTVALAKNENPLVRLNGQDFKPAVRLVPVAPNAADYELVFKDAGVTMTAKVTVSRNALTFTLTDIRESGPLVVRTVEIPGMTLLTGQGDNEVALGNFPAASYASEDPADHDLFGKVSAIAFKDNEKNKDKNRDLNGNRGVSYAFVSDGRIASGLYSNVMEEDLRMILKLHGMGGTGQFPSPPANGPIAKSPAKFVPRRLRSSWLPRTTTVMAK